MCFSLSKLLTVFVLVVVLFAFAIPAYAETPMCYSFNFYEGKYIAWEGAPQTMEIGTTPYFTIASTTTRPNYYVVRETTDVNGGRDVQNDPYVTRSIVADEAGTYNFEYYDGYGTSHGQYYFTIVCADTRNLPTYSGGGNWNI